MSRYVCIKVKTEKTVNKNLSVASSTRTFLTGSPRRALSQARSRSMLNRQVRTTRPGRRTTKASSRSLAATCQRLNSSAGAEGQSSLTACIMHHQHNHKNHLSPTLAQPSPTTNTRSIVIHHQDLAKENLGQSLLQSCAHALKTSLQKIRKNVQAVETFGPQGLF